MSSNFINVIKKTAILAVENTSPVAVVMGVVVSLSPINISLNQKLILSSEAIVQTLRLDELDMDDVVVLLRCQGGQKYIVLDVCLDISEYPA